MRAVSRKQMGELDRISAELGVGVEMLMENAGERVAELAEKMLEEAGGARSSAGFGGKRIAVLCGHGNNGGDGLCAAKNLAGQGFAVTVFLASPREKFVGEPGKMLKKAEKAGVRIIEAGGKAELASFDLIIDALLGFNLKGAPQGRFAELIRAANASGKSILSVDIPSGLDADSGEAFEPCIQADATLTLAFPKKGLLMKKAGKSVGRLFIADIGMPAEACARIGIAPVKFRKKIVKKTLA